MSRIYRRHVVCASFLLVFALIATGCQDALTTQPSAIAQPPRSLPTPDNVQTIVVGQVVEGMLTGADTLCSRNFFEPCRLFTLTAPRTGTLIVTLTWDPEYCDCLLFLHLNGADLPGRFNPFSSVIGRVSVLGGQSYRIGAGFAVIGSLPLSGFSLTTAME